MVALDSGDRRQPLQANGDVPLVANTRPQPQALAEQRSGSSRLPLLEHRASIERLLERMVTETGDSTELRDWVACLVCSLTEHLAQLGNPTWYARFAAQALTDPEYHKIVIKDALASPSLVQVVDGITRCLPELPTAVVTERNIMARNLMMHTCADFERAYAEGADVPRTSWSAVGSGLIDAIVGLWRAPVTEHP